MTLSWLVAFPHVHIDGDGDDRVEAVAVQGDTRTRYNS